MKLNSEGDYFHYAKAALLKRLFLIPYLLFFLVALGYLFVVLYPVTYRATTTLLVFPDAQTSMAGPLSMGGLHSDVSPVLNRLETLADTSFLFQEFLKQEGIQKSDWYSTAQRSQWGAFVHAAKKFFLGEGYINTYQNTNISARMSFRGSIEVSPSPEFNTLTLSMTGKTPADAMLNTISLSRALRDANAAITIEKHKATLDTLEKQSEFVLGQLENTRNNVLNLSGGKIEKMSGGEWVLEKYKTLLSEKHSLKLELLQSEAIIKVAQQRVRQMKEIANSKLSGTSSSLLSRMPASSPNDVIADHSIYNSKTFYEEMRGFEKEKTQQNSNANALITQISFIDKEIKSLEEDLKKSGQHQMNADWLQSQLKLHTEMLGNVQLQTLNSKIATQSGNSQIIVLDEPYPSISSVKLGNKMFMLKIMVVLAFFLALMIVIGRELLGSKILLFKQLERFDGQVAIGSIPMNNTLGAAESFDSSDSHVGNIATYFKFRHKNVAHTLMVTSIQAKAGKTVFSAALGSSMRGVKSKVAYFDLDIKPDQGSLSGVIEERFKNTESSGLRSPISFGSTVREVIGKDYVCVRPLTFADGAQGVRNYIISQLQADLDLLKQHFDFVIVDCPPLGVLDTLQITRMTDEILICVNEGEVNANNLEASIGRIQSEIDFNKPILTIMTKCELKENLQISLFSNYFNSAA